MRVHAYVLAGDPDYLAASITSYYPLVERIVLSVDAAGLSWSGVPMDVDECVRQARLADPAGKIEVQLGSFSHPERPAMECETSQRQTALTRASEGADWVLQLDSDEVVPDLDIFADSLARADRADAVGLDFPARWLYARTPRGFLESSSRFWRPVSGYPGPIAVRQNTQLHFARQIQNGRFRADIRAVNTDPFRDRHERVDQVVTDESRLLHFSWARPAEVMQWKATISGHAKDDDWTLLLRRWNFRRRHPLLATALTPLRRKERQGWLRHAALTCSEPARRY